MTKNTTLDVLKGMAIILVVYGHLLQRTMLMTGDDFFAHPVFKIIYTFHMPLFFFISGYLVARSLSRKNIPTVFMARCQGLLFPHLVWGTLAVLVLWTLSAKQQPVNFAAEWIHQLFITPQIWFLWALFFCSAALLLCVPLQKYVGPLIFLAMWGLMLLIPNKQIYGLYYIIWFFPFYAVGYLFSRDEASLMAKLNKKFVFAMCLVLFAILAPLWSYADYIYNNKMSVFSEYPNVAVSQMAYRYVVGFLGIGLTFFAGAYLVKTSVRYFLEFIGSYSLEIYLLQCFLVEGLFHRIWPKTGIVLDPYSPLFLVVFAPFLTMLAIGLCMTISQWLIRSNPVTNMLFLGRRV